MCEDYLNEIDRIVMLQHPTDMHKGVNSLCGQVRMLVPHEH